MANAKVGIGFTPIWQVFDDAGLPIAGALLKAYYTGTNEPAPVYTDYTGSTAQPWPVVFDGAGRSRSNTSVSGIWLDQSIVYRIELWNGFNLEMVWSIDGITAMGGAGGVSGGGSSVASIAALRALDPEDATYVNVTGYYAAGDGGGGTFIWSSTDSTTDDNGFTIQPTAAPSLGRWKRVTEKNTEVNIKWFGARDGGTSYGSENYTAITAADDYAYGVSSGASTNKLALYVPAGTFLVTLPSQLTIDSPVKFEYNGILKWTSQFKIVMKPIIEDKSGFNQHFICHPTFGCTFPAGTIVQANWFSTEILGGGTLDDTGAFVNAINSIGNGGELFVPSCAVNYNIQTQGITDSIFILKDGMTIRGEGAKSVFKVADNNGQSLGVFGTYANGHCVKTSFVVIDSIAIDGNAAGNVTYKQGCGINGNFVDLVIRDCTIVNCAQDGIRIGGDNTEYTNGGNIQIVDNLLANNGTASACGNIALYNSIGVVVSGNIINEGNQTAAFGIGINRQPSGCSLALENVLVSDNTVTGCNIQAIPGSGAVATNVTIDGNRVNLRTNDLFGFGNPNCIHVDTGASESAVITISNNDVRPNPTSAGIYVKGTANVAGSNISVLGNRVLTLDDAVAVPLTNVHSAVILVYTGGRVTLTGNSLIYDKATTVADVYGIYEISCNIVTYGTNIVTGYIVPYKVTNGALRTIELSDSMVATVGATEAALSDNVDVLGTLHVRDDLHALSTITAAGAITCASTITSDLDTPMSSVTLSYPKWDVSTPTGVGQVTGFLSDGIPISPNNIAYINITYNFVKYMVKGKMATVWVSLSGQGGGQVWFGLYLPAGLAPKATGPKIQIFPVAGFEEQYIKSPSAWLSAGSPIVWFAANTINKPSSDNPASTGQAWTWAQVNNKQRGVFGSFTYEIA